MIRDLGVVTSVASLLSIGVGCVPRFEDRPWLVEDTRVLAIASDPPEARPSEGVALTALIVGAQGPSSAAPQWNVCTRPRTSGERTSVTERCLEGDALSPTTAMTTVLPDACARFGPNPPPLDGDDKPQRPSDPDRTGGYFVPVQAQLDDARAFGAIRVRCDLPSVTRATFEEFEARYFANVPPTIEALRVEGVEVTQGPVEVSAGDEVMWTAVPTQDSAEPYVVHDPQEGEILDVEEWLRVDWFVTAGELERGGELHENEEAGMPFEVEWVAPAQPQQVQAWVVLTDARGGVTWGSMTIEVRP